LFKSAKNYLDHYKMKKPDRSRRNFITTGALALTGLTAFGFEGMSIGNLGQTGPIRIGLIGSGSRGQGLATLLDKIQSFELVACCDTIPENLQGGMKLAAKGARSYTDYKKLLQDKDIQAVIIATPLYLHYPMAVDAMAAGKHIYMEKTMAYSIPQALDLVKKVERSNLVFQVGHQYRYYSMYLKVKEQLSIILIER
jgi:predicted dehydrogenase